MPIANCSILSLPGFGNVQSVSRMFKVLGIGVDLISASDYKKDTDLLILPGVGSYANAIQYLTRHGLFELVQEHLEMQRPLIGICLGFQLLCKSSCESPYSTNERVSGFNIFDDIDISDMDSYCIKMNVGAKPLYSSTEIIHPEEDRSLYYFMHKYGYLFAKHDTSVSSFVHSYCDHSDFCVAAVCKRDSVWGIQFHPEKSGIDGLKFISKILNSF